MLLKSQISNFTHGDEAWFQIRKARFTSSEIYLLMGEKPDTQEALKYIYRKVGEEITGIPIRNEIETMATVHGNVYEMEAIKKYIEKHDLPFIITQKMIFGVNNRFASTPDFIIVKSQTFSDNQESGYNVITGEVKCPLTYDAFISLSLCNTPADLKMVSKAYYFQVLSQMVICGTLTGVFIAYHPDFKESSLHEIQFNMLNTVDKDGNRYLQNDKKTMLERFDWAEKKFIEIKNQLTKKEPQINAAL